MAIELIETSKLFAHRVARIDPGWLEPLAGDLCKKSWHRPHWDPKSQRVLALEKVTLFGFCLVDDRKVFYGRIDREEANRIFIREALVEGAFDSDLPFWQHNKKLIRDIEHEEAKTRSRNLLVDDLTLESFYLERIQGVACLDDLKKLIKRNSGDRFLFMTRENLLRQELPDTRQLFPNALQVGETRCRLTYLFEPGHPDDGVTIHLPGKLLGSIREEEFEYLVPGLLKEKILWLLKNLPKYYRKKLVPIPDKAEKIWEEMTALRYSTDSQETDRSPSETFFANLSETTFRLTRVHIPPETWETQTLPDYLRMNFAVKLHPSKPEQKSRTLHQWQNNKNNKKDEWKALAAPYERWGIETWDFGNLMERIELSAHGDISIWGYRALVLKDQDLLLTILKSEKEAMQNCLSAVPRLLEKALGDQLAWLYESLRFPPETLFRFRYLWDSKKVLKNDELERRYDKQKSRSRHDFHKEIQERAYQMVKKGLCGFNGEAILTKKAYEKRMKKIHSELETLGTEVVRWIDESLCQYHELLLFMQKVQLKLQADFRKRIENELAFFFPKSCLEDIPLEQWKHCPRLLKCYIHRIEKHLEDPINEAGKYQGVDPYQQKAEHLARSEPDAIQEKWAAQKACWMLEELKVSVFAQKLSTAFPISFKRFDKFLAEWRW